MGQLFAGEDSVRHPVEGDDRRIFRVHEQIGRFLEINLVAENLSNELGRFPGVRAARALDEAHAGELCAISGLQVAEFASLGGARAVDVIHPLEVGRATKLLHRLHRRSGLVIDGGEDVGELIARHIGEVTLLGIEQDVHAIDLLLAEATAEQGGFNACEKSATVHLDRLSLRSKAACRRKPRHTQRGFVG